MTRRIARFTLTAAMIAGLSACGGGLFGGGQQQQRTTPAAQQQESTIWDLFTNNKRPDSAVAVNKYLWNASLEVLNFLPVQTIDPFTGVIVTGYGTPPGGGRSYRALIKVTDPALDARSLKVSLQGAGGAAVSPDTVRAVEDAIMTRARQLRVRDTGL